jgi:hypothetical protein
MPAPDGIEPQFLSSDDFHPEFGYLWPTPAKRRRIRKAVMWASAGTVIGAFALLTLAQHGGGGGRGEFVSAAAASAPAMVAEAPAMPPVPPITITDASAAARAPASCRDLLGSFIDPQCKSGRLRKSRSERRASNRVVSVPIGRTAFLNREDTAAPAAVAQVPDEVVAKPAVDVAPEPAASPAKPRPKSARKHKPSSPDSDPRSAYAAAPGYGHDAYNRAAYPPGLRPAPYGGGDWGRSW